MCQNEWGQLEMCILFLILTSYLLTPGHKYLCDEKRFAMLFFASQDIPWGDGRDTAINRGGTNTPPHPYEPYSAGPLVLNISGEHGVEITDVCA